MEQPDYHQRHPVPTAPPVIHQPGYEPPPPYQEEERYQPNCPAGLEYLMQIDQLIIKQQIEILEVLTGFETNNKYDVQNSVGQNIFLAHEDTDPVTRNCFSPSRPFDMRIYDNMKRETIHLNRPLRCSNCCFPCCLQQLEVTSPPGSPIGYVFQNWSLLYPSFSICDAQKNPILLLQGPFIKWNFGGDVDFKILSLNGDTEVGRITKQWGGILKEMFTDADTFSITFPLDLDVNIKATLMGACFLIDFMYYEEVADKCKKRKSNNQCGRSYNRGLYEQCRDYVGGGIHQHMT